MNTTMHDTHPPALQFDQLRAGLLDDRPAERARLLEHLAGCAHCRAVASWEPITTALNDDALEPAGLAGALRDHRRAALAGHSRRRMARTPPRLAIAAAVATVLIGAGVFLGVREPPGESPPALGRNGAVPDIYADLDFYLWLLQENERGESSSTRG